MNFKYFIFILIIGLASWACDKEENNEEPSQESRNFKMGFTSWPYGPDVEDVDDTYSFLETNGDIYAEHIDNSIPWNAWMNDLPLPEAFTNEIAYKVSKRLNTDLLLSVGLLSLSRNELVEDFDGSIPAYSSMADQQIEDAYFKHLQYLIAQFKPAYLVMGIESNELYINAQDKWAGYKSLMQNVRVRLNLEYPNLRIAESMTLHNLYQAEIPAPETYLNEMFEYMNQMDFAAISFYPFFKNLQSREDFQDSFDFLHKRLSVPIAFAETSHIAEDLVVPNLSLSIPGSELEQNTYLQTLLENAQNQNYEFVIWWAHRDYDELWQTFPPDLLDIGQIWRDTGLLDEDGNERISKSTWSDKLD